MNIESLALFEEMYRKGSVAKAAEACFMTPQGANRALRGFETELGCDLFVRTSTGLRPTENGDRFYAFATNTTRAFSDLRDAIRQASLSSDGWLGLGFEPDLMGVMLPALEGFRARFPEVELRCSDMGERALADGLRGGAIDFGFVVMPADEEGIEAVPLGSEQLYVLMGARHPRADAASLPFSFFDGEPLVLVDRGFKARRAFDALCERTGIAPQMPISSNDKSLTYEMVRQHRACTIVAEHERARAMGDGIAAVPLEGGRWEYGICFSDGRGIRKTAEAEGASNADRFLSFICSEID